jgi:hypothetical protein
MPRRAACLCVSRSHGRAVHCRAEKTTNEAPSWDRAAFRAVPRRSPPPPRYPRPARGSKVAGREQDLLVQSGVLTTVSRASGAPGAAQPPSRWGSNRGDGTRERLTGRAPQQRKVPECDWHHVHSASRERRAGAVPQPVGLLQSMNLGGIMAGAWAFCCTTGHASLDLVQ